MQITMADVISLNGKITHGDDSRNRTWSSAEDWQHFQRLRAEYDVIVLDRKTYETIQVQPEAGKLRIVFSSTPQRFADARVPGQLEFVDVTPARLAARLAAAGYQKILLAGGARLSCDFLHAELIDDIYLTFEPVLFGSGRPMIIDSLIDVPLQLQSVNRLNIRGTLLAHYTVIKSVITA